MELPIDQQFVCQECKVFVSLLRRNQQDVNHKCDKIYCETHDAFVQQVSHLCYLKLPHPDPVSKRLPKHFYFDFET